MTPLCKIPYDKQLNLKQQWTNRISKEMRSRLNKAKTPIKLPKVHPISPAVSEFLLKITSYIEINFLYDQPQINEYRNKDEFNFQLGIDGNPKTLGFYVGTPSKGNLCCVPATKLINMKTSHKSVAQVIYIFLIYLVIYPIF